ATRSCSSAPATSGNRPSASGPAGRAPSSTSSSPASAPACTSRRPHEHPPSNAAAVHPHAAALCTARQGCLARDAQVWRAEEPAVTAAPQPIRVIVVGGGTSSEHAVSLASAAAIAGALDPTRFDVVSLTIRPDGSWAGPDGH